MNRNKFIRVLTTVPMLITPFKGIALGSMPDECKTQKDVEGPFYKANAPLRSTLDTDGGPLTITGRVLNAEDCESPISNATLDIWHCDHEGHYDMTGYRGRGRVTSAKNGQYSFTTIFPPPYGSRPRHIHVKVRAEGRPELTTQIYFQGDPHIQNDFARYADRSRVIALETSKEMKNGVFDIYI